MLLKKFAQQQYRETIKENVPFFTNFLKSYYKQKQFFVAIFYFH